MADIDFTRALENILRDPGGEHVLRYRTAEVDTDNGNGTVDIILSKILVPNVPKLAGPLLEAGDIASLIVYKGQLIVLGRIANSTDNPARVPAYYYQQATNNVVATTVTNLTGCVVTFNTVKPNAVAKVFLTIDWDPVAPFGQATYSGYINVDGSDVTQPGLIFETPGGASNRTVIGQQYRTVLASPGSHTIQARVERSLGSGTVSANAIHSVISATVYESA